MRACRRGETPAVLAEHGECFTAEYVTERATNPRHVFRWRHLYAAVRAGLAAMTQERCAYCDGYPLGDTGDDQIDHFRPRSRYPALVCTWDNLFLVCAACNGVKRDRWHDDLLRPDDADFAFERYFEYREQTGALAARTDASDDDRRRAEMTIRLLDLNRAGKCMRRRETVKLIRAALRDGVAREDVATDIGHRFLISLVA